MNFSIDQTIYKASDVTSAASNVNHVAPNDPEMMRLFEEISPIYKRHAEEIDKEVREVLNKIKTPPTWLSNPICTGIYRNGKELILSGYYEKNGNKHFTHDEALEIERNTDGWRLPTLEDHEAIRDALFDSEKWEWKENVCGTNMNGYDYLTKVLGYELGGYRGRGTGVLTNVGRYGYSWSSTVIVATGYNLNFGQGYLIPSFANNRAFGFQVRLIKESSL